MDELKKRAWRIFVSQHGIDECPIEMVDLVRKVWDKAFDKGVEYKDEYNAYTPVRLSDDGNVSFVPKSDDVITGDITVQEKKVYSLSDECSGKSDGGGGLAELAFVMAAIALVISGVTLVTLIVQSLAQAG